MALSASQSSHSPAVRPRSIESFTLFTYSGINSRVPQDFVWPAGDSRNLFQLWVSGDPNKKISPYRNFQPQDFVDRNVRKRLSDVKALCGPLEQKLRDDGFFFGFSSKSLIMKQTKQSTYYSFESELFLIHLHVKEVGGTGCGLSYCFVEFVSFNKVIKLTNNGLLLIQKL